MHISPSFLRSFRDGRSPWRLSNKLPRHGSLMTVLMVEVPRLQNFELAIKQAMVAKQFDPMTICQVSITQPRVPDS